MKMRVLLSALVIGCIAVPLEAAGVGHEAEAKSGVVGSLSNVLISDISSEPHSGVATLCPLPIAGFDFLVKLPALPFGVPLFTGLQNVSLPVRGVSPAIRSIFVNKNAGANFCQKSMRFSVVADAIIQKAVGRFALLDQSLILYPNIDISPFNARQGFSGSSCSISRHFGRVGGLFRNLDLALASEPKIPGGNPKADCRNCKNYGEAGNNAFVVVLNEGVGMREESRGGSVEGGAVFLLIVVGGLGTVYWWDAKARARVGGGKKT